MLSNEELAIRREAQNAKGWRPASPRKVSSALKTYAKLVMSADKGTVRDPALLEDWAAGAFPPTQKKVAFKKCGFFISICYVLNSC